MKNKLKTIFNVLGISLFTGLIFVGAGYFYLNHNLKPADTKTPSVPYSPTVPDSKGIMFDICGDRTLAFMNFESNTLSIIFDNNNTKNGENLYGYTVDFTVEGNYDLLAEIIDIAGGIDLEIEKETFRYTGVQITDILSQSSDRTTFRREIILAILKKIQNTGFQKNNFLYIIENSNTNLTIPDCYYWSDYIKGICGNVQIIN